MKTSHILSIVILFVFAITTASMLVAFHQPAVMAQDSSAALLKTQVATPTPVALENISEVGSTDGILIMGVVITIIVIVPMLFRKKK